MDAVTLNHGSRYQSDERKAAPNTRGVREGSL